VQKRKLVRAADGVDFGKRNRLLNALHFHFQLPAEPKDAADLAPRGLGNENLSPRRAGPYALGEIDVASNDPVLHPLRRADIARDDLPGVKPDSHGFRPPIAPKARQSGRHGGQDP
jgi:hypothetical protein